MSTGYRQDDGLEDQVLDCFSSAALKTADLLTAAYDELRSRPLLLAGLGAAGGGAVIGLMLANRSKSRAQVVREAVEKRAQAVGHQAQEALRTESAVRLAAYAQLVPLALKLWENRVIRGVVLSVVRRQLSKRLA